MVRVKTTLATVGLLAVGAVCLYEFGLSDEAKSKLKTAALSVKASYDRINQIIEDAQGVTMKDESPLPNAQSTAAQWQALGF